MDRIRDVNRVARGLAIDVQENRRLSIRRHHGVNGHHRIAHGRDVFDVYGRSVCSGLDDDIADLLEFFAWPVISVRTSW